MKSCQQEKDPLEQLVIFLVLVSPYLDTTLQMEPQKGIAEVGEEGRNHLPQPDGHPSVDAAQHTVALTGCKCTLQAHTLLFVHQDPQILLYRSTGVLPV